MILIIFIYNLFFLFIINVIKIELLILQLNKIVMEQFIKLRDWIDIDKLDWNNLSLNPNAIDLLEKNFDKINWYMLSANPNAIHLLEQNQDKINWSSLSFNPNAIHLLEQNIDKIDWLYCPKTQMQCIF